jgi:ABC-type polysaccharide/polyol phosphate export permease
MKLDNFKQINKKPEYGRAWDDLRESFALSWFWLSLGWNDTLQRYRGSLLGPFWITITTAVFIAGLGPLYARLFNLNMAEYLPFMAIGVTVWGFITGVINDSCTAFTSSAHMMKQVRLPRLAIIFRVIWRNIIAFLHNAPIFIFLSLFFGLPMGWHLIAILPGFFLVVLNLVWIGLVAAILCARYRDIGPIISSILQIGFFVTPVMWSHKTQSVERWIVEINPFAGLIELIRAPLMGEQISPELLQLSIFILIFGMLISTLVFVKYRRQIIYWV